MKLRCSVPTNDLPNVSQNLSSFLFADDTTLAMSGPDYGLLLGEITAEISKIKDWTWANRLTINADKTFSMTYSNRLKEGERNDQLINLLMVGRYSPRNLVVFLALLLTRT